ncbi:MAG: rhomboid family intramembrane serine protease [Candidatus Pacearchaeota archaeon]|nr:rhomboid family intramembrane serine protease [Candidatus Pacearchaeota archaeon]
MRYKRRSIMNLTFTLILINIVSFFVVLLLVSILGEDFIYKVAVQPIAILRGRNLWTLVTNMFVHGSFWHLFVNMFSLYFLGTFLERLIGKKRFIFIYLLSGIIASLFFVFLASKNQLEIPAVGASGAIFGIAGVLTLLTPRAPVYIMFIPIAIPLWIGVILTLVVIWIFSAASGLPIGNTAHLGGFIAGLLYGLYLRKKHARKIVLLDRLFKKMY